MAAKSSQTPKKTTKKEAASKKIKVSKETYIKWYKDMLIMRKFEENAGQLYIQHKVRGFYSVDTGQDAIVAGAVSATKPPDVHMTAYSDHAHPIGLGTEVRRLMAKLYGRQPGVSKGKGG